LNPHPWKGKATMTSAAPGRPSRQVQPVKSRSRNQGVLFNTPATCAHASNYGAVSLNWDPTAENHDSAMVCRIDPETLLSALRYAGESGGRHVECPCSPGFVDRDVHAPEPRTVHARMCHQTAACIYDGDVIGDFQFHGFPLARGNGASGIL
jgi:hypothetical protein